MRRGISSIPQILSTRVYMRKSGTCALLVLAMSFGLQAMAEPPLVPQPEGAAVQVSTSEYESHAIRYKSGFAKMETRAGDYAVTVEKGLRTGSGSDNTLKTKLSFTTSTTDGRVATAKVQREVSTAADYSRVCDSISEGIFDTLLEGATGASLCRDDPAFRTVRTVVHATIGLKDDATPGWQLDAVALPPVDDFGSRAVWGRGVLTNGNRSVLLTYRSDSPWSEEQCLQMRQDRDERKWECYRKVVELEDDGGLLAWYASNEETYAFRLGLDDASKLAFLAAMEAFRKGKSGPQGIY